MAVDTHPDGILVGRVSTAVSHVFSDDVIKTDAARVTKLN